MTNDKPTLVVTGASGRIGHAVLDDLSRDHHVVGLDAKTRAREVDLIECDLASEQSTARAFSRLRERNGSRIASVVHLAEYVDFSDESSHFYQELNIQSTSNIVKQLQAFDVEQLVFSSSLLVMKPAAPGHRITELSPTETLWPYPQSKREAEQVILDERGSIPTVILRIAATYDDECHSFPLAHQIQRIYEKSFESHFFPGNRAHGQSFVHADDIVRCVRGTVERRRVLSPLELFLVGEPEVMSYGELQDEIGTMLHGTKWTTIRIPKAVAKTGAWVNETRGDDRAFVYPPWMVDLADAHYAISIDHAEHELGWTPRRSIRDTLPTMIERLLINPQRWYQENDLAWTEALEEALATLRRLR